MTDAGNALFYKHLMRISSKSQVTLWARATSNVSPTLGSKAHS